MSGDKWLMHYWPLAGRGEFIRLIFEEAGIAVEEMRDTEELFKLYKSKEKPQTSFHHFAPPVLFNGDFSISQTPIICKFLGKKFGMYPETEADEWHAEQLNATIHDYIAEGRLAFHGLNHTLTYHQQVEQTKPYIQRFVKERLPKFLKHFEIILKLNNEGKSFLFGNKLTYVDLALLHVLRATESQFPEVWKTHVVPHYPSLVEFKKRMELRPKLAEYFKSTRCQPFEGNSMM